MIDISNLQSDDRTTFKVYVQGDERSPDAAGFVVLGPHSAEHNAAVMQMRESNYRAVKAAGTDPEHDEAHIFVTQGREYHRIRAEACTVGMFGFTNAGDPVEFTMETLKRIFDARPLWFEHISLSVMNEANFTKG